MRPRHGVGVTLLALRGDDGRPVPGAPADAAATSRSPPALGALVGALVLAAARPPTLTVLVPVLAATLVSALAFEAVKHGIADPGLRTLIAPLVTFLPGGVLTTATVELASGEMVAGASRLVFGGVQLLLLAFGIVAGVELAGLPERDGRWRTTREPARLVGAVARRGRVRRRRRASTSPRPAARCRGSCSCCSPPGSARSLGDRLVGGEVSGFFGALAMTPVALAIARAARRPAVAGHVPARVLAARPRRARPHRRHRGRRRPGRARASRTS